MTVSDWDLELEERWYYHRFKESFWDFVKYGFGVKRNPRGHWLTESVHKPICDLLQEKAIEWLARRARKEQGRTKMMFIIPRGFGKTVIITKAFPTWLHLRNPDLAVLINSETSQKAIEFLAPVKTLLEGGDPYGLFTAIYGSWYDPGRIWRDHQFTHAFRREMALSEPSFDTCSVDTGATGAHPDVYVGDDPISFEKIREKGNWIQLAVQQADAMIPIMRTDSLQVQVGTPYTKTDVISTLLETEGVKETHGMKMPESMAQPTPEGQWIVYYLQARDKDGQSVLPKAWSTQELDRYERKKPMDFASQMMCNPGTGSHMPLTEAQIDALYVTRESLPSHMYYTIHLDTAFKELKRKASGDDSVIEVFGHDLVNRGDVYFIEGYGSNAWSDDEFCGKLVSIVQRYRRQVKRVRAITDEVGIGGKQGLWAKHLQNKFAEVNIPMPPFIQIQRAGTRKHVRIAEAAGYWTDGRMRLLDSAPGLGKLKLQMLEIGVGAHDDWSDAAADVFHPEIYNALHAVEGGTYEAPQGPYDQYLKTGRMSDEGAIEAYDLSVEEEEAFPWARTER